MDIRSYAIACALSALGCAGCARSGLLGVDVSSGAGSGAAMDWDPASCRSVTLEGEVAAVPVPGTVLLVFDRSGSMIEPWGGQPRWEAAGAAIANALTAQPETLTVGAVFFPSPDSTLPCVDPSGILCMLAPEFALMGTCKVTPIAAPDQIDFAPSPAFLASFKGDAEDGATAKYAPLLGGMTPLSEALLVAQSALRDRASRGATTVVVITDGEPNCAWDQATATQVVADWQAAGIDTYVVGLPGLRSDAEPILDALAATGGTDTYITPDDADAIEERLGEILLANVSVGFDSCTLELDPPAERPDDLHVIVSERGQERALAQVGDDGEPAWNVTPDGSTVELVGSACAAAMSGAYRSIRFEFDCALTGSAGR